MVSVDVEFRHEAVTFAEQAVAGQGEPFGVELEPEAQRPPGNRETLPGVPQERPECLRLLVVEPGHGRGRHAGQQERPVPGMGCGEEPLTERHPPGGHVPPCVADGELGQQHPPTLPGPG
jgi:hypothetical protein